MPKVKEVLIRKEHHGQVWYETKPVKEPEGEKKDEKVSLEHFPRCPDTPE